MDVIEKLRDLDHGLPDSLRLKIADLIEEQRERLLQFANAFDAGYAAAEALSRTGAVKDAEAARDALRELAGVKMDMSLEDWCRISNTILSALEPAAPEGQQPAALTYGQKLIAEAISSHFGERGENYDEYEGDTTIDDVWDAFDALTRPAEQAVKA